MAIDTDIEVNWNGTVDNTNKIGLSKPFTELAADVWADDSAFITAYNNPAAKFVKVSDGYPECRSKQTDCPWYLTGGIGYSNINHNSDSIYLRSAIICIPDDFVYNTWNGNQGGRIRDNINNFRIVTSMSTEKNGVDVSLTVQDGTVVGAQYLLKETLTGSSSNGGITIGAGTYVLMIVDIYTVEGNYYLNIPYSLPGFVYDTNNGDGVMGMWAYDSSVNKMFSLSPQIFPTDDGRISIVGGAVYNVNTWNRHELPAVDGDANLIFCASYIPWNWYLSLSGNVHYHLLAVSRYGLKFKYNNEAYKPIITQGVVTGYTTDMTVPSDIDNWTDISGHNISPVPPVPPSPSGDDLDDIDLSDALYGAGMAHYYICTKASGVLNTISEAMGNLRFSEAGTNLFPNLISCKLFPSGTGAVPAQNSTFKIAGKELLDPDDEQPIQIQEVTGSPSIIIEDIAIERKFGDFRDYAPYTMIELYVPFCGWTALPSWSMGGTVSGKIIIDIIDGSCKAVIEVTKNGKKTPVAELSGCCSLDIPFTAENVGAKMAGIMSAMSASATAALESAVGVGTLTVTGGKSGGKSVVSGLTSYAASLCQATLVNNQNYTQVTGRTGDGCNLGGVTDIVLKIQRPNTTEYSAPLYVPDGFAHAIGFMSMKQKKVSECTGLIICDNVDTSGIGGATDEERAEIKRVLETGLYVNAAPE